MTKKKTDKPFKDDKIENLPNPEEDRADKILRERRITVIVDEILEGSLSANIVARAVAEWGITKSQAYRYVEEALVRISATADEHRAENAEVMFERYMFIYKKQSKLLQYAEARKTLDSMCRLMGLNKEQPAGSGNERPQTIIINTSPSNGNTEASTSTKQA